MKTAFDNIIVDIEAKMGASREEIGIDINDLNVLGTLVESH